MPNQKRFFLQLSLVSILSLLTSCAGRDAPFLILTDRKELATAATLFDAAHPEVLISVHHVPYLDAEQIRLKKPDLIVGNHLSSPEILDLLRHTDSDFPVYKAFNGDSERRERRILTHLSFGLPLIVGKKEVVAKLPGPVFVEPGQLMAAAIPYTERNAEGRPVRLGYSPSWNPEFCKDLILIRDSSAMNEGVENIDEALVNAVVTEARNWIVSAAGDLAADTEFNRRYRYVTDEYLILSGRVLFAYMNFGQWHSLPDSVSGKLDFRYLSGPGKVPVTSLVSAGVPKKSRHKRTAQRFIEWMMTSETQSTLMARWNKDGITTFGFLGGLSTIPEVNDTEIVRRVSAMTGKIPESHYYAVPDLIPHRWLRIQESVMNPWFSAAIAGTSTGSIAEAYRFWDLSSLVETD